MIGGHQRSETDAEFVGNPAERIAAHNRIASTGGRRVCLVGRHRCQKRHGQEGEQNAQSTLFSNLSCLTLYLL